MNKLITYEEFSFEIIRMQHNLSDSLIKLMEVFSEQVRF